MDLFRYESTGFLDPVCFWRMWAHLTDIDFEKYYDLNLVFKYKLEEPTNFVEKMRKYKKMRKNEMKWDKKILVIKRKIKIQL